MSEEQEKDSLPETSRTWKQSVSLQVSSSASVKSDWSKGGLPPVLSEEAAPTKSVSPGSQVFGSVKSDYSKGGIQPDLSEESSYSKSFQNETTDVLIDAKHENFKDKIQWMFQDLENKIIDYLKIEMDKFKKILQNEQKQFYMKNYSENSSRITEAALDLTLYFLREMKEDDVADTLEAELISIRQLKCGLQKKYQCVFEGIANHGDSTLLNNIYTDLYITQGGSEQVNTEHEVRQIEVASRRQEAQEIQVECKHLFESSADDKQIRTVLTKGVAGIGKSVSVQKFVLDWAEGKENQDISFIFPLPFREMNLKEKEKLTLIDLITHFFLETKGQNLTKRNGFKVLFILDGLDECRLPLNFSVNETCRDVLSPASLDVILTNLIKGNLLPSALIWITSRPAAASKIPPDCIDRVTEIRGFNDTQKEEYFRKRLTDENQAKEIIDHIKQSKSLFIMCHIPVFCWISATVLQNILQEKRNNAVKTNQADDTYKSLQESKTEDTPKTLTQMYTHFLRFQIQQSRRKYDRENTPDVAWDKNAILSLGKLAFDNLERNNLIFYDTDLEACGIDVYKASVYSGMCTQIFKEETGIVLGTMYCFVHLSIQEFIAALYAHLFLDTNKRSVFDQDSKKREESMTDLLKTAVDKALESDNGHLDLFLRFLLGLSLQSNRRLLQGLLTQRDHNNKSKLKKVWYIKRKDDNDWNKEEIVEYIKQKFEANLSPERSINLFYCLNELNDQTLVKEIQSHLNKGSLSSVDLSPAQWSALTFILLTSNEEMEFELQKFKKSDDCLIRLSAVLKTSRRALLNDCNLTDRSCSALAEVLSSDTSSLKDLDLSNNDLQDSGVKLLSDGLKNVKCDLEILKLADCSISEEGYKALASALRSNPSHLIELDLRGNDLGQSGVEELTNFLQHPHCTLKKLRLSKCGLTEESCSALAPVLRSDSSSLKDLDLSNNNLQDSGVMLLCDGLKDNCKLEKLKLSDCSISEDGYKALASALKSNPLHLIELDLRGNDPGQSGVKELTDLLEDPHCTLNTLRFLSPAAIVACQFVPGVVGKNPLLLKKLNLSYRELGDTRVNQLSALLQDKHCQINTLTLWRCSITEEQCEILTSALKSNPSHLRELNLRGNKLGDSGVKNLSDLLMKPQFKLEKLHLLDCSISEKQFVVLTTALKCEPSHLRELDLSKNELGDDGVKNLSDLLMKPQFKLEKLQLRDCTITEEQCVVLTSALKSNPSHLRELNLSVNKLRESGVRNLSDLLMNPQFHLEKLDLWRCSITEEQCVILTSALKSNPSHLRELNLSGNQINNTGVNCLADILNDSLCKLETLRLWGCGITDVSSLTQCLTNTKALQFLKDLDLTENHIGDSKQELIDVIQDSNCKLRLL